MPTKNNFFSAFLRISVLSVDAFTSFFKDNKSLRIHKTVEVKVFLKFLLAGGRIRINPDSYKL